jgi:hypothetical protein
LSPARAHALLTSRRWARYGFGGALLVVASTIALELFEGPRHAPVDFFLKAWPLAIAAAFLAGAAGRLLARYRPRGLAAGAGPTVPVGAHASGLSHDDGLDPKARLARRAQSIWLPLVGVSLLAPLSLHLLVHLAFGGRLSQFDLWMRVGLGFTAHAHVVLALLARSYVRGVVAGVGHMATRTPVAAGVWAVSWTAGVACLPGALIYMIPPGITFVTGLVFVPMAFVWADAAVRRDSELVAIVEQGER